MPSPSVAWPRRVTNAAGCERAGASLTLDGLTLAPCIETSAVRYDAVGGVDEQP